MSGTVSCSTCGKLVARDDSFCPGCGASMSEADTATGQHTVPTRDGPTPCMQCGTPMGRDDRFCRSCGASRADDATVVSHVSLRNAQAAQLIAATEGEFEVLERIGHGAMGAVYVAKDVALGRRVAIKVIAPHLLADPAMVSRFKLEAQTVASLRHPNIVNVHAVREADDLHYFVMEYIDGPTLRSLVKRHAPLDFEVVRSILYQVGSALNYAHQAGRGVIHRDIKPANIMLNGEGDSFLTDFGISKITEVKTGLTQTGATIGTPEYMSPEQCRGEELTGASDQYALGIVAYEMICGATPFSGTQYSVMVAHAQEPPQPVRSVRPDCPAQVADAVERMLAKTPSERWPDLDAAVEAMGGRPMGFRDPTRAAIVSLVHATLGAAAGSETASDARAPTKITEPPTAAAPQSTPETSGRAPTAKGATVVDQPAAPGPARARRPASRRALAGALTVAAGVLLFFGGRAYLGGPGATLGNAEGPTEDVPTAETPVVDSAGIAENALPTEDAPSDPQEIVAQETLPSDVPASPEPERVRPRPTAPTPVPASIVLSPPAGDVPVGGREMATASVRSADGTSIESARVSWTSRSPDIVSVDGAGILTAFGEGPAWIVASAGRVTDSVQVSARAQTAEVQIQPGQVTLEEGQTRILAVRVLGPGGVELPRDVIWTSSNPAVVTVSPSGEARGVAAGTAILSASTDGVEGRASVQVDAAAPSPPSDAQVDAELQRYLDLVVGDRRGALAFWPEGTGDEDLREELDELMGRDDLTAAVQERSAASLAGGRAAVTFVAAVTHRGNFGRDRRGTVTFTMELAPAPGGWSIATVRAESFDGF